MERYLSSTEGEIGFYCYCYCTCTCHYTYSAVRCVRAYVIKAVRKKHLSACVQYVRMGWVVQLLCTKYMLSFALF